MTTQDAGKEKAEPISFIEMGTVAFEILSHISANRLSTEIELRYKNAVRYKISLVLYTAKHRGFCPTL